MANCTDPKEVRYAMGGAAKGWPKEAWFPRPHRVRLVIGQPRTYAHLAPGKQAALTILRELRDAVVGLRDEFAAV